jgi:uncharacterized protein (TIGR00251 family)
MKFVASDGAVSFPVRVHPRAKRNAVVGVSGEALKISVRQPPEDGRANDAVVEVLADWLDVKRRQVEILAGATSRNKVVRVIGLPAENIAQRLSGL